MSSPRIENLTAATFTAAVQNNSAPVLVDFWATWCGPCKALAPVLDQVAEELGDAVKICKVNIEEAGNMPLAQQFGVQNIPTLLVFKNGQLAEKLVGLQSKAALVATLQKHQ